MTRYIIVLLMVSLLLPVSVSAESYLCIVDQVIGFKYNRNKNEWKSSTSFPSDTGMKYIFSGIDENDVVDGDYKWKMFVHGRDYFVSLCEDDFDDYGFLSCKVGYVHSRMNLETMRFSVVSDDGYVTQQRWIDSGKEGEIYPLMQIGKCSRI